MSLPIVTPKKFAISLDIASGGILLAGAIWCGILAFADFPYWVYQLSRWIISGLALVMASSLCQSSFRPWGIMLAIALIYNPFIPFRMPKDTWAIVNWLSAGAFTLPLLAATRGQWFQMAQRKRDTIVARAFSAAILSALAAFVIGFARSIPSRDEQAAMAKAAAEEKQRKFTKDIEKILGPSKAAERLNSSLYPPAIIPQEEKFPGIYDSPPSVPPREGF